jgi:hypothetical protein
LILLITSNFGFSLKTSVMHFRQQGSKLSKHTLSPFSPLFFHFLLFSYGSQ